MVRVRRGAALFRRRHKLLVEFRHSREQIVVLVETVDVETSELLDIARATHGEAVAYRREIGEMIIETFDLVFADFESPMTREARSKRIGELDDAGRENAVVRVLSVLVVDDAQRFEERKHLGFAFASHLIVLPQLPILPTETTVARASVAKMSEACN